MLISILSGVVLAAAIILASRRLAAESWSYSYALLFLPVIYMGFGLLAEGGKTILLEGLYGLPFILLGLLALFKSFRYSAYLIASLWLLHAFYDLYHNLFFINTGVVSWYPFFCAAVDFVIGAYLFYSAYKWKEANLKHA